MDAYFVPRGTIIPPRALLFMNCHRGEKSFSVEAVATTASVGIWVNAEAAAFAESVGNVLITKLFASRTETSARLTSVNPGSSSMPAQ